jgi:deoxyadenosine/deoxycytidine kinase
MRVAIVGGPGVGKSTLVRQLADLYHNGSYGEGEKGVWDPRVLEDIATGRNPVGVTAYFAWLYDANYRDAAGHDGPDKVIFFEGARITLEAHIAEYPREYHDELRKVALIGDRWSPDKVIVLTSSTSTIEKHIKMRNRPHEDVENMVRRFRLIDGEFRRLAPAFPNTIVIDRDSKEFHDREGLVDIIQIAGLPMFREVPYKEIEKF